MRYRTLALLALILAHQSAWAQPVYFIDPIDNFIYSYDSETAQGGFFASVDPTNPLNGVACDKDGNIYASTRNFIYRYTPAGVRTTFFTGTTEYFRDLVVDLSGTIYACSSGKIYRIQAGALTTFATGFLNGVVPLTCDVVGNVYGVDSVTGVLYKITPAGGKSSFATGETNAAAMAVDAAGDVFVADGLNGELTEYSPSGSVLYSSGFPPGPPFNNPTGLAIDVAGRLYGMGSTAKVVRLDAAFHSSFFAMLPNSSHPISDIATLPLPEPGVGLLFLCGLAPLAAARRRFKPPGTPSSEWVNRPKPAAPGASPNQLSGQSRRVG